MPPPPAKSFPWTLEEAVQFARKFEEIAPAYGMHVGLTGGCLYKDGGRKDADFLLYKVRQTQPNVSGFLAHLWQMGFTHTAGEGWCVKVEFAGKKMDLLFPDDTSGNDGYPDEETAVIFAAEPISQPIFEP